jgi:hypothetical protein
MIGDLFRHRLVMVFETGGLFRATRRRTDFADMRASLPA